VALYVGTSGWAYREWKPDFYPADLPRRRFLEYYSSQLNACEINATFYRLQSESTFAEWSRATPSSFKFATKAHRGLSHARGGIAAVEGRRSLLDRFLKSVATLGPRLGVVLWQFPARKQRDDAGLERLLDMLPADVPHAFEFRHESWDAPAIRARIAQSGGTVCVSEVEGDVPAALPAGPFGYVRLRCDRYTDEARRQWLKMLQHEATDRDVFAFTKHEGIPPGDPFGGIGLAQWLAKRR
jgi:uncharacterized protein YecE (DUF72 family)